MKTKIEIGLKVNSSKYGEGTITRIITKSTGYVEVNFNGNVRKEMAFNLTVNGIELKSKPVKKESSNSTGTYGMDNFNRNLKKALENETGRTGLSLEQLKSL
jgi:hypothetical protein